MSKENKCYCGQWKIPSTTYNKRLYCIPKWIECDCCELAQQVTERKGGFIYPTGFYHCKNYHRTYQLITGTNQFFLVSADEKKC
ncbi:hypothetical protein PMU86_15645 [Enterococcus casseliflavus]|nr:hypothetical protein [Enterococcus casseliflavus]MDB1689716.1 hypothetical protein [Enterococcus casseliflavus]